MDKSLDKLAVLYADVSGSTRLYEQYGDDIARADISVCIELLADITKGLSGEPLKTIGDEIMCAFVEPVKAALAATEMQAGLLKASEEDRFKMGILHIKIGWHFGAVSWRDDELIGEAPITAQQIINMAKADEILTSKRSVDVLPLALFPNIHPIETVPAEAWSGDLEICKMPWEQTGEETQISSKPHMHAVHAEIALTLEYAGTKIRVDTRNTTCTIGRGKQADLQVDGKLTSRQHAVITCRQGRFNVRDESTNGSFVVSDNGDKKHLRREEGVLVGAGTIGFGAPPDEDPGGSIRFISKS